MVLSVATIAPRRARISGSGGVNFTRAMLFARSLRAKRPGASALPRLEARVLLVDHVDAPLAPDDAAVLVALLERAQRIADFHGRRPMSRRARKLVSSLGSVNP